MAVRPISAASQARESGSERGSRPISRRERQRRETRERLFQTALEEIREVGFAAAQIDRIAERAGVARGTFYFHFPTKEHVLLEAQRRVELAVAERFEDLDAHRGSLREFLRRVFDTIRGGESHELAFLRREIMAMYVRQPNIGVQLSAEPLILVVVDGFADLAERGEIRSDVAPERLAILYLGMLFVHLMGDGPEPPDAQDALDLLIDVFARGVSP